MSESRPGDGPGQLPGHWTSDRVAPEPDAHASPGTAATGSRAPVAQHATSSGDRRPPLWVWAVLAVVVVLVVGVVAAIMIDRSNEPPPVVEAPEAEVVTLPPPTPTIEPIEREAGTPFVEALPSTVLAYGLVEVEESPTQPAIGPLEAHRLVYTDGSAEIVVHASQWLDAEQAAAVLDEVVAELAATEVTSEPGAVEVDGSEVGRSVLVEHADGTGTIWWTNATVLVQADGPHDALRDFFTAFPL